MRAQADGDAVRTRILDAAQELFASAGYAGAIFYTVHHITIQTTLFLVTGLIARVANNSPDDASPRTYIFNGWNDHFRVTLSASGRRRAPLHVPHGRGTW